LDNPNIFLDTCVILYREFSRDKNKTDIIEEFLKQKNVITSTYVNMELNRTYFKDSHILYTMLQEHGSLEKVRERIEKIHFRREKERLGFIYERITADSFNLHEAKIRLERLIKWYHTILLRGVNVILSKTECEQCLPRRNFKCRGSKSMCRVNEVVEENKVSFEAIRRKFLENLQKDITRLRICRVIAEIVEVPDRIKQNPDKCFCLGDILIALDVPEGFDLVSEDKHFLFICDVLNIPFCQIGL